MQATPMLDANEHNVWFYRVARSYCDAMMDVAAVLWRAVKKALAKLQSAIRELAELLNVLKTKDVSPSPWQQRPRKPEIRPLQHVDAVAAGRHPAMILRTKLIGGRR